MGKKCAAWIGISIEIDNSQIHKLEKQQHTRMQSQSVLSWSCSSLFVITPPRLQLITPIYTHQQALFITINNAAVQSSLLLNHRRAAGSARQLRAYMQPSHTHTHIHTSLKLKSSWL